MQNRADLPVAVLGAGPIGLAAAANLIERGITPLIFESGQRIAANIWDWKHVQLFTPWSYLVDPASQRLLEAAGQWPNPPGDEIPFAKALVENYLDPLANLDVLKPHIHLNHRVTAVGREGHDRMKDGNREAAPFMIVTQTPDGPRRFLARAVIDATGTWHSPNPMGAGGLYADGEGDFQDQIRYGIPDIMGEERARYAGKRVLVVGSGHSAIGSLLSLAELSKSWPDTQIAWAIRRHNPSALWGGANADELRARGALRAQVYDAVHSGQVHLLTGLSIGALQGQGGGVTVLNVDGIPQVVVDEIIVAAGSRPDLSLLGELRLHIDPVTQSAGVLGPLIDPNHHSCGTVRPHGAEDLAHPERDFYIVGMKSYGRAPTFLLRTGYEQVRSVVAELAGDHEAARRVELVLPQTGVCSTDREFNAASCC